MARRVKLGDLRSAETLGRRGGATFKESHDRRNKMYLNSLQPPGFYCNLKAVTWRFAPRCFLDGKDCLVEPIDENRWALFFYRLRIDALRCNQTRSDVPNRHVLLVIASCSLEIPCRGKPRLD